MTENEAKTNDSNEKQEQLLYAKRIFGICIVIFIVSMGILISNHLSYLCLEKSLVETVKDIGAAIKSKHDVVPVFFAKCRYPPLQWLDWFLASLAGVLLYILTNIAYHYQKSIRYYKYDTGQEPNFIAFTPWYISTIVKAPVIAFVVLIFLTNLNIEIAGLTLNFSDLNAALLLVIAFVLGFYSRVARKQLDQIVKTIFNKAYSQAEEEFVLVPRSASVVFGQSQKFNTSPYTDVTWVSSAGTIEDGLYIAPADQDKDAVPNRVINIAAVPKDPNIPRASATVTLVPFKISGDNKIVYEEMMTYQVEPDQDPENDEDTGVSWTVSPDIEGAVVNVKKGNLEYTAPTKEKVEKVKAKLITITAKSKQKAERQVSIKVEFKDKEES